MGCDIHSVVQVRKNDEWVTVEARPLTDERDYHAFAVLANVRNYQGLPYLASPRGLPSDFKIETNLDGEQRHPTPFVWFPWYDREKKDPRKSLWMGSFGHSFLMLPELRDGLFRLRDQPIRRVGFLTREQYKGLQETGKVEGAYLMSLSEAQPYVLEAEAAAVPVGAYILAAWVQPFGPLPDLLVRLKNHLEDVARQQGVSEDSVRYVFGFDEGKITWS